MAAEPLPWGAYMDGEVYGTGTAPWDDATWRTFAEHAGRWPSIVHYGQPLGEVFPGVVRKVLDRGATPMISLGTGGRTIPEVAAGAADRLLDDTGDQLAQAGGSPLLRPWWEFNGEWFDWGREPEYARAWRRMRRRIKQRAPAARFVWCSNTVWEPASDPAPWFPGREHVDVLGLDGYCRESSDWKWPGELLGPTARRLREICPRRPLIVCETGCVEDPRKPEWTRRLLTEWAPRQRAQVVWFNWNIREGGGRRSWPIESSPAAQAAFRAGINSGHWSAALG